MTPKRRPGKSWEAIAVMMGPRAPKPSPKKKAYAYSAAACGHTSRASRQSVPSAVQPYEIVAEGARPMRSAGDAEARSGPPPTADR